MEDERRNPFDAFMQQVREQHPEHREQIDLARRAQELQRQSDELARCIQTVTIAEYTGTKGLAVR